jgi:hypothetical protein
MVRTWSIVLGIGLIILGIAGLNSPGGTWIAWLDIAGGIISFFVGASAPMAAPAAAGGAVGGPRYYSNTGASGGLLFICAGLFAMWIAALVTRNVTPTMAWWNFAFACAYGLLVLGSAGRGRAIRHVPTSIEGREQEGPRRVA